jgi:predicted DNA-binding protein
MDATQIPPEFERQFETVAGLTGEPKDALIREALQTYLEDFHFSKSAQERLKNVGARTSLDEIGKKYDLAGASIEIPVELDLALEDAAARAGLTKEEFAQEILTSHLEDESLPLSAFTPEQLERLKESAAQLDRGEFVTAEEVDRKFEAFFARLAAR